MRRMLVWFVEDRRGRQLLGAVLAAEVLLILVAVALRVGPFGGPDAQIYVDAVRGRWQGNALYDYQNLGGFGFTYPPFAALAFSLLAWLPGWWPVAAFQVQAVVASLLVVGLTLRELGLSRPRLTGAACLLSVPTLALYPVFRDYSNGQIDVLLVLLIVVDLLVLRARRPAGVLIGLAIALKLTPAVFVLLLVARRRWRAAGTAVATATAATALTWTLDPETSQAFWLHRVWDTRLVGAQTAALNQSLAAAVARWSDPEGGVLTGASQRLWLLLVLGVAAVTLVVLARLRGPDVELRSMMITALLGLEISPISWHHHWVWLAVFVPYLVIRALRAPGALGWLPVVLAFGCSLPPWWLLGGYSENDAWRGWGNVAGSALVWWGLGVGLLLAAAGRSTDDSTTRSGVSGVLKAITPSSAIEPP